MKTGLIGQRTELIERIKRYDDLINSYHQEDMPKSDEELELLNLTELKEWLQTRITQYQCCVDSDIALDKPGCT